MPYSSDHLLLFYSHSSSGLRDVWASATGAPAEYCGA